MFNYFLKDVESNLNLVNFIHAYILLIHLLEVIVLFTVGWVGLSCIEPNEVDVAGHTQRVLGSRPNCE